MDYKEMELKYLCIRLNSLNYLYEGIKVLASVHNVKEEIEGLHKEMELIKRKIEVIRNEMAEIISIEPETIAGNSDMEVINPKFII